MSSSISSRILGAATAVLALLTTAPGTATAAVPTTREVGFHGHVFRVPADWAVVDLTADPHACVRFDRHAVYLGAPSADQDCPTHAVGRTEALLVEAVAAGTAPGTTVDQVEREVDAADATVRVTGTFGTDPDLIRGIIAAAGLPVRPPEAASPQARPSVAPQTTTAALPAGSTNYTGKGFDACTAPSSATMSSWMSDSPYNAVGIYIGGGDRACGQSNLTASWVRQQALDGWKFLPLYVGPQADEISSPGSQGNSAADDAADRAAALGFAPGSLLHYDMEDYSDRGLTANVLNFLGTWTTELHARGYRSAVYGSASSVITDLVGQVGTDYPLPDVLYTARWNGAADTYDPVLPASLWADHQRVHQYAGDATETWGGATLGIDRDYLDIQLDPAPVSGTPGDFGHDVPPPNGSWAPRAGRS